LKPAVFFRELRHRKVLRAAAVYAVIGWAVIEASDTIFPALSIPEGAFTAVLVITLVGFPVALVAAWMFDITSHGVRRTQPLSAGSAAEPLDRPTDGPLDGTLAAALAAEGPASPRSIAVLAFANMSDDPDNEYFSDGVTEEIINALARVAGLHVAARTSSFSFKGMDQDVTEIGRRLRVATVLEGSVRKAGQQVRIAAQLVNAADGYHIWSEVYDRELADIFEVQEEIARAIVDKLKVEFMGEGDEPLVQRHTENLDAYNLYLRGRYFWNQRERGLTKGIEYLEHAIAADGRYALAYSGLADSYNLLGFYGFLRPKEVFPKAKVQARKALELDPELGEAHASLAFACMLFDWKWADAEGEFRRAMELCPAYVTAHHWYSEFLLAMGRMEEGIAEARQALRLDPIGLIINTLLGMALYLARDYEEAIEACKKTLELEPDFLPVYLWLGLAYGQTGRHDKAIEIFEKAKAQSDGRPAMTALLGLAYAVAGRTRDAETALEELREVSRTSYVSPFDVARIHIGLGEGASGLERLEDAYEERSIGLVWMGVDPTLDPVRSDPGFQDLLRRMDLQR
jgi:serine/threonine-protein kinase